MNKSLVVSLFLTTALTACDGSDSSSTGTQQNDDSSGNGINGNLTGSLVYGQPDNTVIKIDLDSGGFSYLPLDDITTTIANDPDLQFQSSSTHVRVSDGTPNAGIVQSYLNCWDTELPYYDVIGNACYTVYRSDLSKVVTRRMSVTNLEEPLILSRSQNYLLSNEYIRYRTADDKSIHISAIDVSSGETLVTISQPGPDIFYDERRDRPAIEWGLDDEIIYTEARDQPPVVYITQPASSEIKQQIKLPAQYQGLIERMHLSPDGTQLLMQYKRDGGPLVGSFPMILDLNTLILRVPAIHAYDIDHIPVGDNSGTGDFITWGWSPDGRHILLSSLWTWLDFPYTFTEWELFAVPSDGSNQIVSHFSSEAEPAPGVVQLRYKNSSNELEYLERDGTDTRINWVE